ncbi:hypothetical protein [Streptococcus oricebi]|uniref:Uncharacterized protein n=1 Tax=Streptococcus oricebi TaxID=1547447 RepID=A0ABS5B494_9STRE|nr:hypothetical protein [Streptococcus oricebi]MBP2623652.1 hypothetical protein [Streptococcus oricebi]
MTIEMMITLGLLLLHLILSLISYFLIKTNKVNLPLYYMVFAVALPFVGILFLMVATGDQAKNAKGLVGTEEEEGQVAVAFEDDYSSNAQEDLSDLISLEDALLLKEAATSRKLLLDIIGQGPEEFLDLLYLARLSDDTEVVHYATTVIAELSRQYDLQMMDLEKDYLANPEDPRLLGDYCHLLKDYLGKNLVTEQVAQLTREEYAGLLAKMVEQEPSLENYIALIENDLELKRYKEVEKNLTLAKEQWPRNEKIWLLQLDYYYQMKKGEKIGELVKSIKEENIYISAENRALVEFWS